MPVIMLGLNGTNSSLVYIPAEAKNMVEACLAVKTKKSAKAAYRI